MAKILIRIAISVVVVVGLVYGGILLYTKVINPPEDKLNEDDLTAVVSGTSDVPSTEPDASTVPPAPDSGVNGTWLATSDSTVGYRVKEVLGGVDTEGVGRTNQVNGSLTIQDTTLLSTVFEIDVASITSDSSRRDAQFAGNIMDTATFPTANFRLLTPIELGTIPADGQKITATAFGELTLHGVTNQVSFDITATIDNGIIGVLGSIDITFADYGIANPSNGFVTTGDIGLLEFVLAFQKS
ncbi:MAG: YceI family protein [Actinomycetota bacterium]|nr:YceI family protein [Actinomycetota bacterium]MDA3018758.1 YceI family protein [Actinomycetota bacterium]